MAHPRPLAFLAAALLLVTPLVGGCSREHERGDGYRMCVRVVDGDTIFLDAPSLRGGGEKIRLIGVDAPELHRPRTPVQYFARESKAYLQTLVENKRVRVTYDFPHYDRWHRTLAYVYLEDGTFVNLEMVRRGYAAALTQFPFRFLNKFRDAAHSAREGSAGLWAHTDSVGVPVANQRSN